MFSYKLYTKVLFFGSGLFWQSKLKEEQRSGEKRMNDDLGVRYSLNSCKCISSGNSLLNISSREVFLWKMSVKSTIFVKGKSLR